jgi:hypothetical protein
MTIHFEEIAGIMRRGYLFTRFINGDTIDSCFIYEVGPAWILRYYLSETKACYISVDQFRVSELERERLHLDKLTRNWLNECSQTVALLENPFERNCNIGGYERDTLRSLENI